ncbi:MAG: hypothetical protein J0I48_22075 [Devosia sp.]|nr:hypothetical protein [Devosia sp.]
MLISPPQLKPNEEIDISVPMVAPNAPGRYTGYFRLGAVRPYLEDGRLKRVKGAPEFSYSVHMVYSSRVEAGLIDRMRRGFQVSSSG